MNPIKTYSSFTFLLLVLFMVGLVPAQSHFGLLQNKKTEVVRFKLINNLIIIPVEVNGTELSFLLDTGVSKPILFNLTENDSIEVKNISPISLRGLGGGEPITALHSVGNTFQIKNIFNSDQELYVVMDDAINFSPRLGVEVNGIIGHDLFEDFIVEVNYSAKKLKFHRRDAYKEKKCRNCEKIPLDLYKRKPYVNTLVSFENKENIPAHLLVDSGSSDGLWLFEDEEEDIVLPNKSFDDFLGRGLSGSIYGKRSKIKNLSIAGFKLENVKVAFPDSLATVYVRRNKRRNGSLGGEVLKRFNLIYDYEGGTLSFKKNGNFKEPFNYNMSGIELQYDGIRLVHQINSALSRRHSSSEDNSGGSGTLTVYFRDVLTTSARPNYTVAEIRKGSPGALAGLREGDVLLKVNQKSTHEYNLQEVMHMLHGKVGKKIRLLVERNGKKLVFSITLKSLI